MTTVQEKAARQSDIKDACLSDVSIYNISK